MNNNAIGHIKNLGGELVDVWKANNLYWVVLDFRYVEGKVEGFSTHRW